MKEIWKPIESFEGYEISSLGRVRSVDRIKVTKFGVIRTIKGQLLSISGSKKGYWIVKLYKNNKKITKTVHVLMGKAFFGTHDGVCIDHIDRNTMNNDISNLRVATRTENMMNKRKKDGKCSSEYKGVLFKNEKRKKKYLAQIHFNKKRYFLGHFLTQEEAAKAYNKKALELCGNVAYLNKV